MTEYKLPCIYGPTQQGRHPRQQEGEPMNEIIQIPTDQITKNPATCAFVVKVAASNNISIPQACTMIIDAVADIEEERLNRKNATSEREAVGA